METAGGLVAPCRSLRWLLLQSGFTALLRHRPASYLPGCVACPSQRGRPFTCWVNTPGSGHPWRRALIQAGIHRGSQDAGPVFEDTGPAEGMVQEASGRMVFALLAQEPACSTSCPVLRYTASGGRVLCLPGDPLSERPPHCLPDARHCCHPCANYHRKHHVSPRPPGCRPTAPGGTHHPRGPSHASRHQGERAGFVRVPGFGRGGG